jgi:hypothetical protein
VRGQGRLTVLLGQTQNPKWAEFSRCMDKSFRESSRLTSLVQPGFAE